MESVIKGDWLDPMEPVKGLCKTTAGMVAQGFPGIMQSQTPRLFCAWIGAMQGTVGSGLGLPPRPTGSELSSGILHSFFDESQFLHSFWLIAKQPHAFLIGGRGLSSALLCIQLIRTTSHDFTVSLSCCEVCFYHSASFHVLHQVH